MSKEFTSEQREKARKAWNEATSFNQICELTARFIEGTSPFMPCYGADSVGAETEPLIGYLAAYNRAGFLTTCSQPGEDLPHWKQRAFVDGFALEPVARLIARLSLYTDLHIVAVPPGMSAGFHTPVTLRDFVPHTWTGFSSFEELDVFREECGELAFNELLRAWSISIIDLQWGRKEHLWREVAQAICYSEKPHPDLGLEIDFAV